MYNNMVCSPSGLISPPNLYGDSCARSTTPGGLGRTSSCDGDTTGGSAMEDRFSSLEAQYGRHRSEIGMLRESVQGMSQWRASMDAASGQTSDLLKSLDEDIGALKEQIGHARWAEDKRNSSLEEKVESYAAELSNLKALESLQGQLEAVDSRLAHAERILVDTTVFEDEIKTKMSEIEVLSGSAAEDVGRMQTDVQHIDDSVDSLHDRVDDVDCKIETIRLALEVVEQSLDDFNESEIVESLRSRMEDLDVGIEKVARDSDMRVRELSERVDALKFEIDTSTKADEAFEIAQATSLELSDLKRELKHGQYGPASGTSTPSTVSVRSSDARVKAAVHTLSDGYRSLHKAMGLMYEEHSQLSQRVSRAGLEAHESPREMTLLEKIRADDAQKKLQSFPIDIADEVPEEMMSYDDDFRVLLAAQLKDSQRAEQRIESLENQVLQLKQIIRSLISSPPPSKTRSSLSPSRPIGMSMEWSSEKGGYTITLQGDTVVSS